MHNYFEIDDRNVSIYDMKYNLLFSKEQTRATELTIYTIHFQLRVPCFCSRLPPSKFLPFFRKKECPINHRLELNVEYICHAVKCIEG